MTRDDSEKLISTLGKRYGLETGLNQRGFGGMTVEQSSLYFEFREQEQALECDALIYRFHAPPKAGVLESFEAEAANGVDTGGGTLVFLKGSRGLFLSRTYRSPPDAAGFESDMKRLVAASCLWSDEVLDRVSARAFRQDAHQLRSHG